MKSGDSTGILFNDTRDDSRHAQQPERARRLGNQTGEVVGSLRGSRLCCPLLFLESVLCHTIKCATVTFSMCILSLSLRTHGYFCWSHSAQAHMQWNNYFPSTAKRAVPVASNLCEPTIFCQPRGACVTTADCGLGGAITCTHTRATSEACRGD
jgi:hypothetical protein